MARPGRLVLLGHPVAHSLSPVFQNALLRAAGVDLDYVAVDAAPAELSVLLRQLAEADASGNVTVPHKEAVASACSWLTPIAKRVGAVNTFWSEEGTLFGDNTDVGGFVAALLQRFPDVFRESPSTGDAESRATRGFGRPLHAVVLGAGGSAAAALVGLEELGVARVSVLARTPSRAQALVERFPGFASLPDDPAVVLGDADVIVNATPVGLDGEALPVAPSALKLTAVAMDLTYRRGETPWVLACRARGIAATDGLTMLVEQGTLAFERWFPGMLGGEEKRRVVWDAIGEAR